MEALSSNKQSWLTDQQARKYLGISRSTLYRLRERGLITYSQYGKIIRYRLQDLEGFLMSNQVKAYDDGE